MVELLDSEETREPVSDIDTAAADSLKVLVPKRPIREADQRRDYSSYVRFPLRVKLRTRVSCGPSPVIPQFQT